MAAKGTWYWAIQSIGIKMSADERPNTHLDDANLPSVDFCGRRDLHPACFGDRTDLADARPGHGKDCAHPERVDPKRVGVIAVVAVDVWNFHWCSSHGCACAVRTHA